MPIFVPLVACVLLFLSGCKETSPPSLRAIDFVEALSDQGYNPQKVEEPSDVIAFESERHLRSSLRLRIGQFNYLVREYDLSTPVAARRFRELHRLSAEDANASQYRFENLNLVLACSSRPEAEHLEIFRGLRPALDFRQAGWFLYPLGACLALAVFTFVERSMALRRQRTFPTKMKKDLGSSEFRDKKWGLGSVAERIVDMAIREKPPIETLRAFARMEVGGMERGLFLLEIVVGAAPLLGLLGTVTG